MIWSIPTQIVFRFRGNFGISLLNRLAKGLVITVAQRAGEKKLLYGLWIELSYVTEVQFTISAKRFRPQNILYLERSPNRVHIRTCVHTVYKLRTCVHIEYMYTYLGKLRTCVHIEYMYTYFRTLGYTVRVRAQVRDYTRIWAES